MTSRIFRIARRLGGFQARLSLVAFALLFGSTAGLAPQLPAQNAPKLHRKVVVMFDPEYPAVLKNGHFEGQVRLDATVAANGTVSKVEIRGGNPILAQYASQAVMRWKYAPGTAQTVEEVVFNFNSNSR